MLPIISFHILATFIDCFNLECDYVDSTWYIVGKVKNCYARNLTIISPDQIVDTVKGSTAILDDILGFWVENEICHYIPQKLVAFMPKLKAFGLSRSGLRTISKFDIAPFPELIRFSLFGNDLEYIDGDLFAHNTKIQSINLEDNNLLIINGPILKPLKFLNQVIFVLPCLKNNCEYSSCIPEMLREFKEKCQFESIYPGFIKYFKSIKSASEICNEI